MSKCSTRTRFLETLNGWIAALDYKKCLDTCCVDVKLAFGTVILAKLLFKLKFYGVSGCYHSSGDKTLGFCCLAIYAQ